VKYHLYYLHFQDSKYEILYKIFYIYKFKITLVGNYLRLAKGTQGSAPLLQKFVIGHYPEPIESRVYLNIILPSLSGCYKLSLHKRFLCHHSVFISCH
jgi:hypothetical protein